MAKMGCLTIAVLLAVTVIFAGALTWRVYLKHKRAAEQPQPVMGWDEVRYLPDLRYDGQTADDAGHTLDLFLPLEGGPWPVAIIVHGGAFMFDHKGTLANVGVALARHGVAAAVVDYRLIPEAWPPNQTRDVARAVAFVHAHAAEYGIDPSRLFLVGHSAGAFLAAMALLWPEGLAAAGVPADAVRGAALISGFYDIMQAPMPRRLLVGPWPPSWAADSPITYVRGDTPPILILHAETDLNRPAPVAASSRQFFEALQRVGAPVTMHVIAGADHASIVGDIGRRPSETLDLLLEMMRPEIVD
jgi:acetyl esterase/lipase